MSLYFSMCGCVFFHYSHFVHCAYTLFQVRHLNLNNRALVRIFKLRHARRWLLELIRLLTATKFGRIFYLQLTSHAQIRTDALSETLNHAKNAPLQKNSDLALFLVKTQQ